MMAQFVKNPPTVQETLTDFRSGRSAEEGIGYPRQYSWASLVAQLVRNPPVMRETWIRSLVWEDSPEKGQTV